MHDLVPFVFEGLILKEACWINGTPNFTRLTIGEFLEYKFPLQAITKIIERNLHIKPFSTVVNLTTVEGGREVTREVEVYDPVGLQLIIMESHQPKAIQYKIAAAHLVYAFMRGELKPSRWCKSSDQLAAFRQLLSYPPKRDRGEIVIDIAKQEGVHPNTIYRRLQKTGECLVTSKGGRKKSPPTKGTHSKPEEVAAIFNYRKEHPKAKGIEIKAALGLAYSAGHINLILRQAAA